MPVPTPDPTAYARTLCATSLPYDWSRAPWVDDPRVWDALCAHVRRGPTPWHPISRVDWFYAATRVALPIGPAREGLYRFLDAWVAKRRTLREQGRSCADAIESWLHRTDPSRVPLDRLLPWLVAIDSLPPRGAVVADVLQFRRMTADEFAQITAVSWHHPAIWTVLARQAAQRHWPGDTAAIIARTIAAHQQSGQATTWDPRFVRACGGGRIAPALWAVTQDAASVSSRRAPDTLAHLLGVWRAMSSRWWKTVPPSLWPDLLQSPFPALRLQAIMHLAPPAARPRTPRGPSRA